MPAVGLSEQAARRTVTGPRRAAGEWRHALNDAGWRYRPSRSPPTSTRAAAPARRVRRHGLSPSDPAAVPTRLPARKPPPEGCSGRSPTPYRAPQCSGFRKRGPSIEPGHCGERHVARDRPPGPGWRLEHLARDDDQIIVDVITVGGAASSVPGVRRPERRAPPPSIRLLPARPPPPSVQVRPPRPTPPRAVHGAPAAAAFSFHLSLLLCFGW